MAACWFSPSKEIQKGAICWQNDGFSVLACEGVLMTDYLQKGETIDGEYYASNLRQLKKKAMSKSREKLRAGVLLLQDNAPVHTAQVAVAVAESGTVAPCILLSRFGTIRLLPIH